jgi:hypothetical protein
MTKEELKMTEEEKTSSLRRIRRMLRELSELSEHASMTGMLEKGTRAAVVSYNQILAMIQASGTVLEPLFVPLAETVCFDELGVASRLLRAYLAEDESSSSQIKLVTHHDGNLVELGKLRDVGQLVRDTVLSVMPPAPPAPPTSSMPPAPPQKPKD